MWILSWRQWMEMMRFALNFGKSLWLLDEEGTGGGRGILTQLVGSWLQWSRTEVISWWQRCPVLGKPGAVAQRCCGRMVRAGFPSGFVGFGAEYGGWGKEGPSGLLPFVNFRKINGKPGKTLAGIETPHFFLSLFASSLPPNPLPSFFLSLWLSPWGNRILICTGLLSNTSCFLFLFYFCCEDTAYIHKVFYPI